MQNTIKKLSIILFIIITSSCGYENQNVSRVDNLSQDSLSTGESELRLLMRDMFDEAQQIKQQIAQEKSIEMNLNYELILSAQATEPEKAASAEFKSFADAYLQSLSNLQNTSPTHSQYDDMVESCLECHKSMCPGPLARIETLKLKAEYP